MSVYQCYICGYTYDEEIGLKEENILPGTKWEELDPDWICPDCGVGKNRFRKK